MRQTAGSFVLGFIMVISAPQVMFVMASLFVRMRAILTGVERLLEEMTWQQAIEMRLWSLFAKRKIEFRRRSKKPAKKLKHLRRSSKVSGQHLLR